MNSGSPMSRKVHLLSLGCPKNQVDAEVMLGTLVADGYEVTLDPEEADVLVVNTCSFIQPAKEESIDAILEMARVKNAVPGRKLVVTGCLAQRYAKELAPELPEVDAFVGTGDFLRLKEVLRDVGLENHRGPLAYVGAQHVLPDHTVPRILTGAPFTSYLKISEGCNHRCAFCIIPKIRGPHESRPVASLLAEARNLADQGVSELCLIAQDLTAYGRDLAEPSSLADLLRGLARVDGLEWIRLLYCYPNFVTGELLEAIADEGRVCTYVDMPLQHGSDRMLRAMRRERSADSLRRLVGKIRDRLPRVTLRSSFIVGFPGETDTDFAELCNFVEELGFDRVGVFRYSREENTEAGEMPGQVPEHVKEERWNHLMQMAQRISRRKNEARVGSFERVLACGVDDEGRSFGRAASQAPEIDGIVLLDREIEAGRFVETRITAADDYDRQAIVLEPAAPIDNTSPRP
jgi:ribosomal protein S12 methylthiotransferase